MATRDPSRVKKLIKKFSHPDLKTPLGSEELQSPVEDSAAVDTNYLLGWAASRDVSDEEPESEISKIFEKQILERQQVRQRLVEYVDSRSARVVSSKYVENQLLPFKEKDFNCKLTFIRQDPTEGVKKVFIGRLEDYKFYRGVGELADDVLADHGYAKYPEFGRVFYNYCMILIESGIDPVQDLIVGYVIHFLKNSKQYTRVPAKMKLITRIYAVKNLKVSSYFNQDELVDSEDEEIYEDNVISKHDLLGDRQEQYQARNNWLLNNSIAELKNCNFNLLISRAIRYSIFLHWTKHKVIKLYFLQVWNRQYNLKNRERYLNNAWQMFIKKKYFVYKIHLRFLSIKSMEMQALKLNQKSRTANCWRCWRRRIAQTTQHDKAAVLLEQKKYFHVWQKRSELVNDRVAAGLLEYEKRLVSGFFKKWSMSFKLKIHGDQLRNKSSCRLCFNSWKQQFAKVKQMQQQSDLISVGIVCGPIFLQWHTKVLNVQDQMQRKVVQVETLIVRRYFNQWHKLTEIQNQLAEFSYCQQQIHKRRIFKILQNAYLNSQLKQQLVENSQARLVCKYFNNWQQLTQLNLKANEVNETRLKVMVLRRFNNKLEANMVDTFYQNELKNKSLTYWYKAMQLKYKGKELQKYILRQYFQIWYGQLKKFQASCMTAMEIEDKFLLRKAYQKWSNKVTSLKELEVFADKVFLHNRAKKVLQLYNNKFTSLKEKLILIETQQAVRTQRRYFNAWKNKHLNNKQSSLQAKYDMFVAKKHRALESQVFKTWSLKFYSVIDMNVDGDFFRYKKYFFKWMKKYVEIDDLYLYSIEYHKKITLQNGLEALIVQSNKQFELRSKYDQLTDEKNYHLLEQVFRNWSIRAMKVNQQIEMSTVFLSRWNKVKCKNLFLIWYQKYNEGTTMNLSNILTKRRISPIKSYNNMEYSLEESPLRDKQQRDFGIVSSTPFDEFKITSPELKSTIGGFDTPSKSRVFNVSLGKSEIKNQRLRNLKTYYSGAVRNE